MEEKNSGSIDLLGLRAYGDTAKIAVEKSLDGAGAFLSRICLPVAEEFGLLLKDRVHIWRATNVTKALKKAERKYEQIHGEEKKEAHPRILSAIVENVSWTDNDEIQEMWSGLLISSCTEDGKDDSNLIFINAISQLTNSQVKILDYSCKNATKYITNGGWIAAQDLQVTLEELQVISQINDFHRLDMELDHLRSLELLDQGGFSQETTVAVLTPSALGLHLFVRCQGYLEDPIRYFQEEINRNPQDNKESIILSKNAEKLEKPNFVDEKL